MDGLSDRENQLAEELKAICDENGRELNPIDSAPVLHQLGRIYKDKSPDKISLIQSAALFNAAIARQPTNVEFKEDLSLLCSHLLQLANAKQKEADLIEFSSEVKNQINLMREETNSSLKLLKNIPCDLSDEEVKVLEKEKTDDIESIQNQIAESYTNIMDFISKKCIEIMGVPPCRYAIAGMGSLARKEITPYSDFEHVILLEDGVEGDDNYDKMVEYFRWYSVIFHIIVINLQETIIPSVSILSLNNSLKSGEDWFFDAHTTRGISFDGMMSHASKFPLGRRQKTIKKPSTTELIRPVSQMLHLLDSKEAIKNGYHLADILTTTCFVSGDEEIYNDFNKKVKLILKQNRKSVIQQLKEQLEEDLSNYDLSGILSSVPYHNQVNIKRLIYRSITLFVLAIGRFRSVFKRSCFEVIKSLRKKNLINEETTHRLSYAVAVACQIRLQVYMSKCGQDDYVGEGGHYLLEDNQIIPKLIEIIGERSLIDCCIVACSMHDFLLNDDVFGNLNGILQNNYFEIIKSQMWMLLQMYDRVLKEWKYNWKQKSSVKPEIDLKIQHTVCDAYTRKNEHGKALSMLEGIDQLPTNLDLALNIYLRLICLSNLKRHADVIRFVKATITRIQKFNVEIDAYLLYDFHYYDGESKHELQRYVEALTAFTEAQKYLNYPDPRVHEAKKLNCLLRISRTLCKLGNFKQALKKAEESLTICKTLKPELSQVADCYYVLGMCKLATEDYEMAVNYFQTELSIREKCIPKDKQATDETINIASYDLNLAKQRLMNKQ